jgi:signal transduction histidine kinase/CheY-like chemotaxis protein
VSAFFAFQLDYVFFLYGLAFVLLAAVIRTVERKERDFPWRLLGLFAILHGFAEWFDMLALSLWTARSSAWFRGGLSWLSFVALARFAWEALAVSGRRVPSWLIWALALLPLTGLAAGIEGMAAANRALLAFPAGLGAGLALWRHSGRTRPASRPLRIAAVAMWAYAVLAGLVFAPVSAMPVLPGLADLFMQYLGPAQVWRAGCAAALSMAVWLHFASSRAEAEDAALDRRIWSRRRFVFVALVFVLAAGWVAADRTGRLSLSNEASQYEHNLELIQGNLTQTALTAGRMTVALAGAISLWRSGDKTPASLAPVNAILDRYAAIIPGSVAYFMDAAGNTLASSNRETRDSFVGHYFGFRDYFRAAMESGHGSMVAMGTLTGTPGFFGSTRVDAPWGEALGVAALKVELGIFAFADRSRGPAYLVNKEGVALASNTPEHVLHLLWPADVDALKSLVESRSLPRVKPPLFNAAYAHGETPVILGERRVVVRVPTGIQGLELVQFGSLDAMWAPRLMVICITLLVSVLLLTLFMVQERIRMDASRMAERNLALDEALVKAEEAGRAKGMFLANMSHEIRTPLNGVLGMLDDLAEYDLPGGAAQDVQVARDAGRNLLRVVGDILDFSKIEAGKLEFANEPVALAPMVEAVALAFAPEAARRGLSVRTFIAPEAPAAFCGDAVRIRQVLYNLVGNAMKFTERGEVRLEVRPAGTGDPGAPPGLAFVVSDTGLGIPPDKLEDVFEAFTQADGSATRKHQGTGLGLAIVKALARGMGGHARLSSTPGVGTTVTVVLPAKPCEAPAPGPDPVPASPPPPERPLDILLVEDDRINQITASRFLNKWGHAVTVAGDGRQALDILRERGFDLILMDMHMPVLDGLGALKALRSDPAYAERAALPVVALTANAMKGDRERYMAEGLDGYLSKPIDPAEMRRVINEIANRTP